MGRHHMFESTENLARILLQIQDNKYVKIGICSFESFFSCSLLLERGEFILAFYSLLHQWSNYCFTCEKQIYLKAEEQLNPHFVNGGVQL